MALPALTLRPPVIADEQEFRRAHALLADEGHVFGLGLSGLSWRYYLRRLAEIEAGDRSFGRVPASFLLAEVDGELVGRTSVRFELNAELAAVGGHIGYCVLPAHRRRGYATEILRQSLTVARAHGVPRALLTCDRTNKPSRRVIEKCGGALENVVAGTCRYWIG
ncbi:GNAT family N-acetyltransferase [Actinophytocola glycyrrhizae]|uniref:GNAT family N-acetyltransferase n=1 Tax=Actinophytocola glycyrrhizae TaxID=2044873 RepID=A0ABV9S3X5_9PSEU